MAISFKLFLMCEFLLCGVVELLNHGKQDSSRTTVTANPDNIWEELYKIKADMDLIRKENQELKKNQSYQNQQHQNTSIISPSDIQQLRYQIKAFEVENEEWRKNHTLLFTEVTDVRNEIVNLMHDSLKCERDLEQLNKSFIALQSVQRATASLATTLQGEQIANRLGISELQNNFHNQSNSIRGIEQSLKTEHTSVTNSIAALNQTFDRNMKSQMMALNASVQTALQCKLFSG